MLKRLSLIALLLVTAVPLSAQAEESLNLLFFGNSFTHYRRGGDGVDNVVRGIAVAAGHPEPHIGRSVAGGSDFKRHLDRYTAVISEGLPEGETWDYVVMQGYSTRPTSHPKNGDVEAFLTNAVKLFNKVREHSPSVRPVLFETWARSPEHNVYDEIFASPAAMQAELTENYAKARDRLNEAAGRPITLIAPVGTAWMSTDWDDLHYTDNYHANDRGTLLAALVIYGTIYEPATADLDLTEATSKLDVTQQDIEELVEVAAAVLKDPAPATAPAPAETR